MTLLLNYHRGPNSSRKLTEIVKKSFQLNNGLKISEVKGGDGTVRSSCSIVVNKIWTYKLVAMCGLGQ